jgi:hypothetical protein
LRPKIIGALCWTNLIQQFQVNDLDRILEHLDAESGQLLCQRHTGVMVELTTSTCTRRTVVCKSAKSQGATFALRRTAAGALAADKGKKQDHLGSDVCHGFAT